MDDGENDTPDDSPAGVASRVKLHVAVPAPEFERAIDAAFRKLAREVRIPGFRPGKAPRRLLEARLGTDIAREQALQDALPEYYVDAVNEHDVDVIAPPEIEITAGQEDGDVEFDAVVEIRPQVKLVGYDELRVELPFKPVSDEDVDKQVDALRERFADLADSDVPARRRRRTPTIDIAGTIDGEAVEGLTASDFLYEVGSGMVVDELDDQLRGTKPGAILEFTATLPERFGELAGQAVNVPRDGQGGEAEGAARAHRRVGRRGERVRDRRRAARRHPQAHRDHAAAAGADGAARQGARRRRRSRSDRSAADARRRRDAPPHRGSRPPALASGRDASSSTSR